MTEPLVTLTPFSDPEIVGVTVLPSSFLTSKEPPLTATAVPLSELTLPLTVTLLVPLILTVIVSLLSAVVETVPLTLTDPPLALIAVPASDETVPKTWILPPVTSTALLLDLDVTLPEISTLPAATLIALPLFPASIFASFATVTVDVNASFVTLIAVPVPVDLTSPLVTLTDPPLTSTALPVLVVWTVPNISTDPPLTSIPLPLPSAETTASSFTLTLPP